jgi:hypothetical protein
VGYDVSGDQGIASSGTGAVRQAWDYFSAEALVHGMKYSLFAASLLVAFLSFIASSPANAQTNCDAKELGSPHATAGLSIAAPHVDEADWTSTIRFIIPASWPRTGDLLRTPNSEAFQSAYNCVFPAPYSGNTSARLSRGNVVLELVQRGQISNWTLDSPSPWSLTADHNDILVKFTSRNLAPDEGSTRINWDAVTVTTNGFQVVAPAPLPSSGLSAAKPVWYSQSTMPISDISFTLIPSKLLGIALTTQSAKLGQLIPLNVEVFLCSTTIILLLAWRRKRKIDVVDHTWVTTRRLCYLVAAIALTQVAADLGSQFKIHGVYPLSQDIRSIIIAAFGANVIWHLGGWPSRSLAIITFTLSILSVPGEGMPLIGGLPFLFLCWVIILYGIHALFRPMHYHARRLMLFAALLGLISFGLQLVAGDSFQDLFPGYAMGNISGCIIVFGILLVIAKADRQVALLLQNSDRLLLAVVVGYAMLFVAPRWYLGVYVSIVSIFAIAATLLVLSVSRRHSLGELAVGALQGKTRSQLQVVQGKLIAAQKQLDELKKDLNALDGAPLTNEQFQRRNQLEKDAARLHRWPSTESQGRTGKIARINFGVRRFLRIREQTKQDEQLGPRFPEPAGPADMALVLGPGCEPMGNARKAWWPAVGLALVPVFYFAWHESFGIPQIPAPSAPSYLDLINHIFNFVINIWRELTFWLFPLLALAVAWSSLAGRRGSGRAIQIWLCVSLPLIIHSFINDGLNQSDTLTPILRCALLLIALLSLGLRLDLLTLRLYRPDVTSFRRFQGYLRLNRVIAILTLLLPLITAGLTIWGQIDNGVLHQQVSPTQVSGQTPVRTSG